MRRLLFLLVGIFVVGCATVNYPYIDNVYHNPYFYKFNVRDVAFVSFDMDNIGIKSPFREEIIDKVNRVFVTELEKRNWYRVHKLTLDDLKDFDKTAHIDAIITGKITAYREEEPLRFGLSVAMRSLDTSQTIWSAAYIFDASNKDVVAAMKDYYRRRIYPHHPLLGYRAFVISINKFIEFACDAIIDTVIPETEPESLKKDVSGEGKDKADKKKSVEENGRKQ